MAWSLEEAISYYKRQGAPQDQNALIALFREIQEESGGSIPEYALEAVGTACDRKVTFLQALIRRIPSLRLGTGHTLQLCAGPNCGKHTQLAKCAEALQKSGGNFTLQYVPCMRMCGKGPNLRWDGKLYHGATEQLLKELTKEKP